MLRGDRATPQRISERAEYRRRLVFTPRVRREVNAEEEKH